jgi:hypothetical protein
MCTRDPEVKVVIIVSAGAATTDTGKKQGKNS